MVHSVSTQVTIMAAGSSRVGEVVFESISEEPHQPSSCNHEAGSSKLPDVSSCSQRQNR